MGLPMCLNLMRSPDATGPETSVLAFDTNEKALAEAEMGGATPAGSVCDIALAGCDLVFTMLPGCHSVLSVFDQLLEKRQGTGDESAKGTVFVDCSTVNPMTSHEIHRRVSEAGAGHDVLDAPVSGGVKGARDGTLTFMVGSELHPLETAEPYLQRMGKNVIHCGGAGTGAATKLCNNLALASQMIGVCEAMNLGEALGVDPIVLADVMNTSTAKCWSCEVNNPHPQVAAVKGMTAAAKDYDGGFAAQLMLKDITLALSAAQEAGVALPLGATSKELYKLVDKRGLGKKDFGIMLQFLQGK